MIINISAADLMKNELTKPDWYLATIRGLESGKTTDGTSINYVFKVVLEATGKEMDARFNSKALGFFEPFIEAVTGEKTDRTKPIRLDSDDYIGKKLKVKVINDTYNGRLVDKVDGYAHATKDTSQAF